MAISDRCEFTDVPSSQQQRCSRLYDEVFSDMMQTCFLTTTPEVVPEEQGSQRPNHISETVTDEQVNRWWHIGHPFSQLSRLRREDVDQGAVRTRLESVRSEINQHGIDPGDAIVDAMRRNRVLVFGEHHSPDNPPRQLLLDNMRRLREAGATHVAIEASVSLQEHIDAFNNWASIDRDRLPRLLRTDSYVATLEAARRAGLRIVAVDRNRTPDDYALRDAHMADRIGSILENPENKVVFWVGSRHGREGLHPGEGAIERAASLLRRRFPVCSVLEQDGNTMGGFLCEFAAGENGVRQPLAIRTRDTRTIANTCIFNGRLINPRNHAEDLDQRYGQWDMVILFPARRR
ncbi:MAG: hypothetical protein K2X93_12480 [Candidatus Obscuribacterales bacterium]|nr:hypothetical protein [Candidatus Obscuribacterales bacterium]